jgi:hypothetical protein
MTCLAKESGTELCVGELRRAEEEVEEREWRGRGRVKGRRVEARRGGGRGEGKRDVEVGGKKTTKDKRKPHVSAHLNGFHNFLNAKRLVRNTNFTSSERKSVHVNDKSNT